MPAGHIVEAHSLRKCPNGDCAGKQWPENEEGAGDECFIEQEQ